MSHGSGPDAGPAGDEQEQIVQDLARIEKTQEALRYYLGADHPDVVALDREIAQARSQIDEDSTLREKDDA